MSRFDKPTVLIFDEHSSVLAEWWLQPRSQTLIYLDAHLDLQRIDASRLEKLGLCTTLAELRQLEKPHHLLPDRGFSYGIEDFLYPAHRLGLIENLIWVAPPHVETGYSRAAVGQLQQMEGVQFDELTSFRRAAGGWIEGRLLGLNITICDLQQLAQLRLPSHCLIDIDTDYFITVPGDEVWIDPADAFGTLTRLHVTSELITLSRSVGSGFTPIRYRFLADYLAALWECRHLDSAHYQRILRIDRQARSGDEATAAIECRGELESFPRCPATHYLLSLTVSDPDRRKQHRRDAENLCPSYRPNVARSACAILNRRLGISLAVAQTLEKELIETEKAEANPYISRAALGLLYIALGEVRHAVAQHERCRESLGSHAELALEIGKLLLRERNLKSAKFYLEAAVSDDKTRCAAHVFLALLYRARGSRATARRHLDSAHEMAPAWGDLLLVMAQIHQETGDSSRSRVLLERYRNQQSRLAQLARQLTTGPSVKGSDERLIFGNALESTGRKSRSGTSRSRIMDSRHE